MTGSTELDLMRMHVEALYVHDGRSRIESINQWDGGMVPRFFLGRTKAGNLWRFRSDLPDDLAGDLKSLCRDEPEPHELSQPPVHQEQYIRLLSPVEQIWTGPAYWFSMAVDPTMEPVVITEANADLLRGGLDDWIPDVPHRSPFMAMVENGHAVSVCASVRIAKAAHEAGVESLPAYRRKGHAVDAVAGWANEVRKTGAIPLYSTSWDNAASRGLAAKLGLSMFGVDFHVI